MKYSLLFVVVLLCKLPTVNGQKEANIWYFGNELGLDFNQGDPVLLTDGKLTDLYGSAVMSDENGNLLFYTNGETVWNRNHDTLFNGTNLAGHKAASQAALILQDQVDPTKYYIFTTHIQPPGGLHYSILDMTLDGGLGGISTKNIFLFSPSTEKLTATLHSNNMDIWVLAHETNTDAFYAYLVDHTGVVLPPVISHSGDAISGASAGHMMVSPKGDKLSITLGSIIGLFDFNPSHGIVSNPIFFPVNGFTNGVEFSSDGSKLYYTAVENMIPSPFTVNRVYQANLLAGTEEQINNSILEIYNDTVYESNPIVYRIAVALQSAPDGKIYVLTSGEEYLDVISNPNGSGTGCGYIDSAIYMGGKITSWGLPNFAPVHSSKKFTHQNNCQGQETYFTLASTTLVDSVYWNFNDAGSNSNGSALLNPSHVFSATGTYDVSVTIYFPNSITKIIRNNVTIGSTPTITLGNDTTICRNAFLTFNLPDNSYRYLWNDGSSSASYTIREVGTYWAEATLGECRIRDSIMVSEFPSPALIQTHDTTLCKGDTVKLQTLGDASSYLWNDGSSESFLNVSSAGTFQVQITDQCGVHHSSRTIDVILCCTPSVPNLITSNNDGLNDVLTISCIEDRYWTLEIYNRWGERVYKSSDYQNDFYGHLLSEDIYYYALSKPGKSTYRGWLHIIGE